MTVQDFLFKTKAERINRKKQTSMIKISMSSKRTILSKIIF